MTADDIRTRLDAIDAYCAAATEGPWWRREGYAEIDGQNYAEVLIPGPVNCGSYCYGGSSTIDGDRLDADLAFIADARTDLPAVVAALRDALAEVERHKTTLRGASSLVHDLTDERDAARAELDGLRGVTVIRCPECEAGEPCQLVSESSAIARPETGDGAGAQTDDGHRYDGEGDGPMAWRRYVSPEDRLPAPSSPDRIDPADPWARPRIARGQS